MSYLRQFIAVKSAKKTHTSYKCTSLSIIRLPITFCAVQIRIKKQQPHTVIRIKLLADL